MKGKSHKGYCHIAIEVLRGVTQGLMKGCMVKTGLSLKGHSTVACQTKVTAEATK